MSDTGNGLPAPHRGGVVLLHGFASFPQVMTPLANRLAAAGFRTWAPYYPSRRLDLPGIVARLADPLAAFVEDLDGAPVHFVGHSMGGLIARALIAHRRPPVLGRVVMLGTPNGGSEIADRLNGPLLSYLVLGEAADALVTHRPPGWEEQLGRIDYPLGIIAGDRPLMPGPLAQWLPRPHDGKVSVAATHVEGESAHLVLPLGHTLLPWNDAARNQTLHFLMHGRFDA